MVSTIRLRRTVCVPLSVYRRRSLWAPFFRGLHRLAVDDRRAGRSLSSRRFPNPGSQGILNPLPSTVIPFPDSPDQAFFNFPAILSRQLSLQY